MSADNLAQMLLSHLKSKWAWQPGMGTKAHYVDGVWCCAAGIVPEHFDAEAARVHGVTWWGLPDLDHPATKGWMLHWLDESCVTLMLLRGGLIFVEWDDASGVRHRDAFDDAASALLAVWGEP